MRFIGNKVKLLDMIYNEMKLRNIHGNSFFDFFAGTSNVGKFFKKLNYQIYSSDLLYFSYVLQQAYIVNNRELRFERLLSKINVHNNYLLSSPLLLIVDFLNRIPLVEGFFYNNYTPTGTSSLVQPRMYFTNENGKKIDAIRQQVEIWKMEKLINQAEYFVLLACLIESVPFYANISGVYAAFQKKWDPRALKVLTLRPIEYVINKKKNYVFNVDSVSLIDQINADIYYLDPPYNQRQYAPNYHLLETVARYDNPKIKGVTGLRNYADQKSKFCNAQTGLQQLSIIAKEAKCKTLILSYNTEGIMQKEEIFSVLAQFGRLELVEFDYLRYKSNSNGESNTKKFIKEQLYILQKNEA